MSLPAVTGDSYQKFESAIRKLSAKIVQDPNNRAPVKAALLAIQKTFSDLLATNSNAVRSYNIAARMCDSPELPSIQSKRVQDELKKVHSAADAKAVLEALDKQPAEAEKPSDSATASQGQGWGKWLLSYLPAFVQGVIKRVTGWSVEEKQELREGLKKIAGSNSN